MTMALFAPQLPPEFQAAKETLRAARTEAIPTKAARRARVAGYVLLLVGGCCLAAALMAIGVLSADQKDFWRSGLTAISILSGFMVATMVFTGKIEAAKSLSLSELRDVAAKSNYLLLYQVATLANHLVCMPLMLLTPSVAERSANAGAVCAVLAFGLFFVSIVRSLLIPVQIIELHRFTHAAMLREKRDEAKKVDKI
ncbi:hypothetical protein [Lysobacter auxotrophicus]|uniref:Uncharacterized protein n=1 Tax=Lysobacter auxotrophicus TaxID=2992573 RepID=A0ABM8DFX2_9GAMM|nr:hypothetical protein [Lysobacter auxotrophicus]BDU17508.1 hypothetical protein LA521A_27090 [Lysobacter auxotrophicus]